MGVGDGSLVLLPGVAGDHFRQPVAVAGRGLDERGGHGCGFGVQAVPRQAEGDHGVVVRPDAAAVVGQRVVRGLARGERTDAPAGEEVGLQQPSADGLCVDVVEDAGPQQMAGVRGEGVDLASRAVEGEGVEGLLRHPEVGVETLAQGLGVGVELVRPRGVVPDGAGQLCRSAQGVVGVALCLGDGDAARRLGAVGEADRSLGVLPVLVEQTVGVGLVGEVAALVEAAVGEHPADRRAGVGLQLPGEGGVTGLFGVGAEQGEEQGVLSTDP